MTVKLNLNGNMIVTEAESATPVPNGYHLTGSTVRIELPAVVTRFYRHGWQSWTLTTWLDPATHPLPIRSPQFRAKDEDPAYAFHANHVSAWVGAIDLAQDDIVLLGALDLGGRVELDGTTLKGFYESETDSQPWLLIRGKEEDVFVQYAACLEKSFGKSRFEKPPRVWCSWYSLYKWINEPLILNTLDGLGDLPFDVFQIDDGWQDESGHWEAGKNFPSGMAVLAEKIKATGRVAGLWLSPFIVTPNLKIFNEHRDWLLRNEQGEPVSTGLNWSGQTYALDITHPAVLDWLEQLIRKVVGWGYAYLKLDFLYAGAALGKRFQDMPREAAYRNALQRIRMAAGNAYILACGAPIIPSLGLCDGLRIGPDVSPYWLNTPMSVWLNNPNEPSTQNAIRTSLQRLWLKPLVNIDPDVVFFRSKYNALSADENLLLQALGNLTGFKATSDLPGWLSAAEKESLRAFLESTPSVDRIGRYAYRVGGRAIDFNPVLPIPSTDQNIPVWLAQNWGLLKMIRHQALPAIWTSLINRRKSISA